MLRLLLGLWTLCFGNFLQAEVVSITGYIINLGTYYPANPSIGLVDETLIVTPSGYYYSSVSVVNANNPFHPIIDPIAPDLPFVPYEEYNQSMGTRFLDVVGIPETMITDTWTDFYGSQISAERPFFNIIDTEVLIGLANWNWDGQILGTVWAGGYIPPSAEGVFNQAEQRFYVSDGRQYQVVPEPSSLSLLLAGGAVLMAGRRRESD